MLARRFFYIFLIFFCLPPTMSVYAQRKKTSSKGRTKIIYKYKEKEVIDFSELSIRGNVVSPGDLSIKLKEEKAKKGQFRLRKSFDPEIKKDLEEIK